MKIIKSCISLFTYMIFMSYDAQSHEHITQGLSLLLLSVVSVFLHSNTFKYQEYNLY